MRRCTNAFFFFSLALGVVAAGPTHADENASRIAIIDASLDVRPFITSLKARGVKVVGRYYARCKQPEIDGVGTKRIVDNDRGAPKREVDTILDAGLGIVSIYQYFNNSPLKFSGLATKQFIQSKDDTPAGARPVQVSRNFILPADDCSESSMEPNSAEREAQLDATAAVKQAKAVGQPEGSAIYFGIDFDTTNLSEENWKKMETYFSTVHAVLKKSSYRLGAYGDGVALERLDPLIDYKWILPSPAFNRVTDFYNKKNASGWHLFQSLVDAKWKTGASTIKLDGNVQNSATAGTDIGFWDRDGPFIIDKNQTTEVFENRRFVCNGSACVYKTADEKPDNIATSQACAERFAVSRVVRIGRQSGDFVEVDCDDDGTFDGWTRLGFLSKSFRERPPYFNKKDDRAKQTCK
jgi:hypothetical protein